jgi:hypothetical protein
MKVLTLGHSSEAGEWVPLEQRRYVIAARLLSEALGEPVEPVFRRAWPTPDFATHAARYMHETAPDVVLLRVPAATVCLESVPLRVGRWFGPVGPRLADAALKSSRVPWLAFNPAYRSARWLLQQVIGGDTHFTPAQVAESIDAALRTIASHEGVAIVVEGPAGIVHFGVTRRERARAERRRRELHGALAALCHKYHAEYIAYEAPVSAAGIRNRAADAMHGNADEHAERARTDVEAILRLRARLQALA